MFVVRPDLRDKIKMYFRGMRIDIPEFMLFAIRDDSNMESDVFNDTLGYIKHDEVCIWQGTTDPGLYYQDHPMRPEGCAHIMEHIYFKDLWALGTHGSGAIAHEAFVQVSPVTVKRAKNYDDYVHGNYTLHTGIFATNFHAAIGDPEVVGKWSAGCIVSRMMKDLEHCIAIFRTTDMYKKFHESAKVDFYMFTTGDGIL